MSDTSRDRPFVFLSYASADRSRVLAIADRLEAAGIRVWIDRQAIAGGTAWGTEIVEAIEGAAVVVVCCSAASFASRNVRQELQLAWRSEQPYLPLRLDESEIPKEMRYFLEGCQWVDLLDRPERDWLPEVLRAFAGLGVAPTTDRRRTTNDEGAAPATNLPVPLTECLGRECELGELQALLGGARLVTLTGPGGIGKTRLAIDLARGRLNQFPAGVWFVGLETVTDPALVLPTIAATLGVREVPGTPLVETLAARLDGAVLMVLDNCEQVVASAGDLGRLLVACPTLRLLATSRVPLHIRGEREYPVAPLDLPPDESVDLTTPVVALFVERAREIRPGLTLSADDVRAIGAICRRLDGIPLAVELAAARIRLLSPRQILQRLD